MRTNYPACLAASVALAFAAVAANAETLTVATNSDVINNTNSVNPGTSGVAGAATGTTNTAGTSGTPGTNGTASGLVGNAVVPGVNNGVPVNPGTAVNANGELVQNGAQSGSPPVVANSSVTATPLFDLTARQGMEKEARRKARGEEPRVYGIAPRTNRDLTNQMPDDPIIRY